MSVDRLEQKIDLLADRLASVDKTLAVNTEQLRVHLHRTDLLEKRVERFEGLYREAKGMRRLLLGLGWLVGLAASTFEVWQMFHGR